MNTVHAPQIQAHWFNERSQPLAHPGPWQSAQLEIKGIPSHYTWQTLQLYTHLSAAQAQPLYLKKKEKNTLSIHADWPAAEPGFHHLYLCSTPGSIPALQWHHHFFLAAAPLTQEMWLRILQETHASFRLRLQPQRPVPLSPLTSAPSLSRGTHTLAEEFYLLQSLFSAAPQLRQSLNHLPWVMGVQWGPLYRAQRVDPRWLYRDLSQKPPHISVPQNRAGLPEKLAAMLHFLLRTLGSRLNWLRYGISQSQRDIPWLRASLYRMQTAWKELWQAWSQHPYAQIQPQWSDAASQHLERAILEYPELTPWLELARYLQSDLQPGLAPFPLATGYQNFGRVYQAWCTQHLLKAIRPLLQASQWSPLPLPVSLTSRLQGAWQHAQGAVLSLESERRFLPGPQTATRGFSISRGQQPDLVLLYYANAQAWSQQHPTRGLVFEVKFRQDQWRPRKSDIDRLHAYRDAIYVQHRENANPLFVGGALLYPGHSEHYPPGLQALNCLPDQELRLDYLFNLLLCPEEFTHVVPH